MFQWIKCRFSIIDLINFIFIAFLVLLFLFVINKTPYRIELIFIYLSSIALIFFIGWLRIMNIGKRWKKIINFIYPIIFLFGIFETFYMVLPYFNSYRFDNLMAKQTLISMKQFIDPFFA